MRWWHEHRRRMAIASTNADNNSNRMCKQCNETLKIVGILFQFFAGDFFAATPRYFKLFFVDLQVSCSCCAPRDHSRFTIQLSVPGLHCHYLKWRPITAVRVHGECRHAIRSTFLLSIKLIQISLLLHTQPVILKPFVYRDSDENRAI